MKFKTLLILWVCAICPILGSSQHSVAREWNELLLEAIRNDFARPTVHARNLFHISFAMYDAWAAYDETARPFLLGDSVGFTTCPFEGVPIPQDVKAAQEEAISYAVFRLINHRFINSPGSFIIIPAANDLLVSLGYDPGNDSMDYQSGSPAALGNYIAQCIIDFGNLDNSNEQINYQNLYYQPINPPLVIKYPGNPDIIDYNRWQPLTLDVFIDQSGNEIPFNTPDFLGPEWGMVVPFSLKEEDLDIYSRDKQPYWVYHDPGPPAYLDTTTVGGISEEYKWGFALVSVWAGQLDPEKTPLIDISPASIGNVPELPGSIYEYRDFYNLYEGGETSLGHDVNPHTGEPYEPQYVPLGDYARVLAEFWADGPDSETPPGHWFTILNYVHDHPLFVRKYRGTGEVLDDLEWDVKAYFMLGGAMHDVAVTAWGIKGYYDYIRPVSAIRGMADLGQSSDPNMPSYHPGGIPLIPRYIELVKEGDPLAGDDNENLFKIKLFTWKGPDYIEEPATDVAGVDWILAENWWPYQRPSFVTPPFAGYISGHSTFSRAAAELLTMLTGDPFFPGGIGEFHAPKNEFLVFEDGPSVDVTLQWATYRDASDQTSLSRLWGGIHPPVDDIPGRIIGMDIAYDVIEKAESYFFKDEDEDGYYSFEDCNDTNAMINPGMPEICDGIDQNCNGETDEGFEIYSYFIDEDEDGYGNSEVRMDTCAIVPPLGFVGNDLDCDDSNSMINPDVMEVCDTIDNNCNGFVNEGLELFTYYYDHDEDGFGDENNFVLSCQVDVPPGFVDNPLDCDDEEFLVNPASIEFDDGLDNDCNGEVDDNINAVNDLAITGISVFPNPVHDNLQIKTKDLGITDFDIVSSTGKLHYKGRSVLPNSNISIPFSSFEGGVYFLIIHSGRSDVWIEKIVKIH